MTGSEVRLISAAEAQAIRWPVLRPGLPAESAIFEGDDDAATRHLGAVWEGTIAGVASIYQVKFLVRPEVERSWQLRGMAVLPEARRRGLGGALLEGCENAAREEGGELMWCNARTEAARLYAKHGWQAAGAEFEIPTVGPHFRMWVVL